MKKDKTVKLRFQGDIEECPPTIKPQHFSCLGVSSSMEKMKIHCFGVDFYESDNEIPRILPPLDTF